MLSFVWQAAQFLPMHPLPTVKAQDCLEQHCIRCRSALHSVLQAVTRTNARSALLASLEHLEARRRLEQLLSPEERATLLGPLPIVPPDYHYVVRIPPPEEAATADDEPVA